MIISSYTIISGKTVFGAAITVAAIVVTKGSMTFPGSVNTYNLQIANVPDFRLGIGDFTIEWFAYYDTVLVGNYPRFFSMGANPNASIGMSLESDGYIYFFFNGANSGNGYTVNNPAPAAYQNKWSHYAISRSSGIISIYLNGIRQGSTIADASNHSDFTYKLTIGNEDIVTGGSIFQTEFGGRITNFNWVKGTGLYSGAIITVPTTTITANVNTKLLILANDGLPIVDSSGLNKTVTNTSIGWTSSTPF